MVIVKIDPKTCRRMVCIVPDDFQPAPTSEEIIVKHTPPIGYARRKALQKSRAFFHYTSPRSAVNPSKYA